MRCWEDRLKWKSLRFNDHFIGRFQHTNGPQSIIFATWTTNLHGEETYCTVHYVRQISSDNISCMDDDSRRSPKNPSKQHKDGDVCTFFSSPFQLHSTEVPKAALSALLSCIRIESNRCTERLRAQRLYNTNLSLSISLLFVLSVCCKFLIFLFSYSIHLCTSSLSLSFQSLDKS